MSHDTKSIHFFQSVAGPFRFLKKGEKKKEKMFFAIWKVVKKTFFVDLESRWFADNSLTKFQDIHRLETMFGSIAPTAEGKRLSELLIIRNKFSLGNIVIQL